MLRRLPRQHRPGTTLGGRRAYERGYRRQQGRGEHHREKHDFRSAHHVRYLSQAAAGPAAQRVQHDMPGAGSHALIDP